MRTKKLTLSLLTIMFFLNIFISKMNAQLPKETPEQKKERMAWWTDARFGMFIHWGLYALPARHEWVKRYERLTNEDYQKYFENRYTLRRHYSPAEVYGIYRLGTL